MAYKASVRVSRLEKARTKASGLIAEPLAAVFASGWRRIKPKLDSLSKAEPNWDALFGAWADEFEAAFEKALIDGANPIAKAEAQSWRGYGPASTLDFDPLRIAEAYYGRLGEDITGNPGETTLARTREAIQRWRENDNMSLSALAESISYWFGPRRAELIAINETTRLIALTTQDTMKAMKLERWSWQSRQEWNTCSQCRALHGQVFTLNDPMPPDGSHIGCFCVPAVLLT